MSADHSQQETIVVGKIAGHFGVNGWIKVQSYTRPAQQITEYHHWLVDDTGGSGVNRSVSSSSGTVNVLNFRQQGKGIIARLEGFNCREDSDELIGKPISIKRDQLEKLGEGEYYWMDIIGSKVINQDEVEFGAVAEMMETGANDVMVVNSGIADDNNDSVERLIPWIDEVVLSFDPKEKVIRVDWGEDY